MGPPTNPVRFIRRRWRSETLHVGVEIGGLSGDRDSIARTSAELHLRYTHLSKKITVCLKALLTLLQILNFGRQHDSRHVLPLLLGFSLVG